MPFLNPTLLLFRQTPEHIAEIRSYLPEDRLLAVFRDENKVILTLPTTMT
jgi:thioredoxin-related protein